MIKKGVIVLMAAAMLAACSSVPVTGRKQLNLLPESQMIGMSLTAYSDFLSQNPPMPSSDNQTQMVQRIGNRMAKEVEAYLADQGASKRVEGFQWEFNLVDDPTINAWCMPGGKVVVYTGIMKVAEDEEGLAVIMGHEIAHAIARHGNERMSQGLAVAAGGITLAVAMNEKPGFTRDLFLQSYGLASGLGVLAFSRKHESEADKMGLIFMAMAGYNPEAAPKFWERMKAMSGGGAPPEFLSTHPSHDTRVENLTKWIPEAKKYYKPSN